MCVDVIPRRAGRSRVGCVGVGRRGEAGGEGLVPVRVPTVEGRLLPRETAPGADHAVSGQQLVMVCLPH